MGTFLLVDIFLVVFYMGYLLSETRYGPPLKCPPTGVIVFWFACAFAVIGALVIAVYLLAFRP